MKKLNRPLTREPTKSAPSFFIQGFCKGSRRLNLPKQRQKPTTKSVFKPNLICAAFFLARAGRNENIAEQ